jgi:SNF2 family DNA or RNA helicase
MKLVARLMHRHIEVKQDGGFGTESRSALRAVAEEATWDGKRATWIYEYSPGVLPALREAASMLEATLVLDDQLHAQEVRIQAAQDHEWVIRKLIQTFIDDKKLPIAPHNTAPVPPPWRHQSIAFHWAMRISNLYLALKPGLGKTRIGSDVVRGKFEVGQISAPEHFELPERPSTADPTRRLPARWGISGGVLVVCPSVVLGEWHQQLQIWQAIEAITITGSAERKRYRAGLRNWVHVCSYDSLESVEGNQYDGIIADEAHFMANEESNRFRRMINLRATAKWVIALSGTPVSNMLPSLWAQFYWLDLGRSLGPTYEHYRKKYFTGSGRDLEAKNTSATRVSAAISRVTMFLTMDEAFPGEHKKIHQVIRIPMTDEQLKYYEMVREKQAADIVAGTVTLLQATTRLTKLLQIVQGYVYDDNHKVQEFSSAKLRALEDMITGKGDLANERCLIWCDLDPDADKLVRLMEKHGIKHLVLRGGMLDNQKKEMAEKWQTDHTYRYLIGKISMGIGINLHAPRCVDAEGKPAKCKTTIFYGMNWRVTQLEQAMDRTYRGDQTETCLYRYLLSDDLDSVDADGEPLKPIDARLYECLLGKLDQATAISEDSSDYVRGLLAA